MARGSSPTASRWATGSRTRRKSSKPRTTTATRTTSSFTCGRSRSPERRGSPVPVVVPLGRVGGEVLHELPIVPFGVVEVDALARGVGVGDSRFHVPGGEHPGAERLGVLDLEAQVVDPRQAAVRL